MDETTKINKKHIAQIVKVVNDILEAQSVILQRIESAYQQNIHVFQELSNKVGVLEKKIEGGFTVLESQRLASLDTTITNKLKNLELGYVRELKKQMDSTHMQMVQQIQARMFELLIKESQKAPRKPQARAPSAAPTPRRGPSYQPYGVPSPAPAPAAAPVPEMEAVDGEWSESELEGAQIYDTIITGWKRRDWEKHDPNHPKGTKEMFMRGWKKLSSSDRQKIKNGAWSKPIINKLKMLGRSA